MQLPTLPKINILSRHNIERPLAEINQNKIFAQKIVNQILYSKRLLVDHVESLERCIEILQRQDESVSWTELFTLRNTSIALAGTLIQHFLTPKNFKLAIIPTVLLTGGFTSLFITKNAINFRNKLTERELDKMIKSIDEFGNCIKRNVTYFNEILAMKSSELVESRQIERAWDCITSSKEVIEILYDATRNLEENYSLPEKCLELYSPMEELRDCDYFKKNVTDYNTKNLKDFYNIYAYVQSQFLLRLALVVSGDSTIPFLRNDVVEVRRLIEEHVNEEEAHFRNLSKELKRRQEFEALKFQNSQQVQANLSGPVAVLKDSSLKLNSCMIAVAEECQKLDEHLQHLTEAEEMEKDDGKSLLEVAGSMRLIESSLSVCCDDFHRLMIVYNKFLSSKLSNKLDISQTDIQSPDGSINESILRVEISNDNTCNDEKKDDFYACINDKNENRKDFDSNTLADYEILNFEERVTKKKFRPVLKQLKDRIDPIREEMLDKERKVLLEKGINVDQFLPKPEEQATKTSDNKTDYDSSLDDDQSSGSADEVENEAKKMKTKDNYAEMRKFLADKPKINLFKLELPQQTHVDESIIEESFC